jgi:hypothetical protein
MAIKRYYDGIDYCKPERAANTDYEEVMYLREVDFSCPLCGKKLFGKSKKEKIFEIAHIFPHSPTLTEKIILNGVELLGNDSESFENKIALCKICHRKYDNGKTIEEYNRLVELKKKLFSIQKSNDKLSLQYLEDEIIKVLKSVSLITDEQLAEINEFKALRIDNKIYQKYTLLRRKVKRYVSDYYLFIEGALRNLDVEGKKFKLIASQFRTAYLSCDTDNQDDIFNRLVRWVKAKNVLLDEDACAIVVSFFIQNCEVYDEIT